MKKLIAFEVITMFTLIEIVILVKPRVQSNAIFLGLVLMPLMTILMSWLIHNDFGNVVRDIYTRHGGWRDVAYGILGNGIILVIAALALNQLDRVTLDQRNLAIGFLGYIAIALLQQILLQEYFTIRLHSLFGNTTKAAIVSGLMFSLVHVPNIVLVPLTLANGIASAWLFLKYRNIVALAIGHAYIGSVALYLLPKDLCQNFKVGSSYSLTKAFAYLAQFMPY